MMNAVKMRKTVDREKKDPIKIKALNERGALF